MKLGVFTVLFGSRPFEEMLDHVVDRFRSFVERVVYVVAPSFAPAIDRRSAATLR